MLGRHYTSQQVGSCVAHAAKGRVTQRWHVSSVQVQHDEVKFIALHLVHGGAVPESDVRGRATV